MTLVETSRTKVRFKHLQHASITTNCRTPLMQTRPARAQLHQKFCSLRNVYTVSINLHELRVAFHRNSCQHVLSSTMPLFFHRILVTTVGLGDNTNSRNPITIKLSPRLKTSTIEQLIRACTNDINAKNGLDTACRRSMRNMTPRSLTFLGCGKITSRKNLRSPREP
ncbi:hypothetical protein E4T43_06712 [Aureobasidium subglaciale]|nr:hypothetical protein E4T43_06712 [Aureobasidium subglaciale]